MIFSIDVQINGRKRRIHGRSMKSLYSRALRMVDDAKWGTLHDWFIEAYKGQETLFFFGSPYGIGLWFFNASDEMHDFTTNISYFMSL